MTTMNQQSKPFRQRLLEKHNLSGIFQCIPHFQVAEILSHTSLDFIMIEAEHGATALPSMHAQVAAIADRKPLIVRVASGEVGVLKPILDLGVTGIMVPDVRSAETAREIVAQTRFAPAGKRGIGGSIRASKYGFDKTYFSEGPADPITVILQIESEEGLQNAEEIAAVEGVDAVFFGPMDLSAQLGVPGQPTHPKVRSAIEGCLAKLNQSGVVSGCLCAPDHIGMWQELGMSLFLAGSDIGLLIGGTTTLMTTAHHQVMEKQG